MSAATSFKTRKTIVPEVGFVCQFFTQGLAMHTRLITNSNSSCFSLPSAGIRACATHLTSLTSLSPVTMHQAQWHYLQPSWQCVNSPIPFVPYKRNMEGDIVSILSGFHEARKLLKLFTEEQTVIPTLRKLRQEDISFKASTIAQYMQTGKGQNSQKEAKVL